MKIDFPAYPIGEWQRTPLWVFWRPGWRRQHWRWTVDWRGCECTYVWQYTRADITPPRHNPPPGVTHL